MGTNGYDPPSLLEQGAPSLTIEIADVPSGFDFGAADLASMTTLDEGRATVNDASPTIVVNVNVGFKLGDDRTPAEIGREIAETVRRHMGEHTPVNICDTSAPSERIDKDDTE